MRGTIPLMKLITKTKELHMSHIALTEVNGLWGFIRFVQLAKEQGINFFRGQENNVLARVVAAHQVMNTHTVVKICGDMPLLDPLVIDKAVQTYQRSDGIDVVTTTRKRFFPDGVDVEVFPFSLLAKITELVVEQGDKEHVTSYLYRHPKSILIIINSQVNYLLNKTASFPFMPQIFS